MMLKVFAFSNFAAGNANVVFSKFEDQVNLLELVLECSYDALFITNAELAASVAPVVQVFAAFSLTHGFL